MKDIKERLAWSFRYQYLYLNKTAHWYTEKHNFLLSREKTKIFREPVSALAAQTLCLRKLIPDHLEVKICFFSKRHQPFFYGSPAVEGGLVCVYYLLFPGTDWWWHQFRRWNKASFLKQTLLRSDLVRWRGENGKMTVLKGVLKGVPLPMSFLGTCCTFLVLDKPHAHSVVSLLHFLIVLLSVSCLSGRRKKSFNLFFFPFLSLSVPKYVYWTCFTGYC